MNEFNWLQVATMVAALRCRRRIGNKLGGRTVGPCVAWDLEQPFLAAEYGQAPRHLGRLGKVASLESGKPQRERKTHVRR